MLTDPFQSENRFFDGAVGDIITNHDGSDPWRHRCNVHPGVPKTERSTSSLPLEATVPRGERFSKAIAHRNMMIWPGWNLSAMA